MRRRCVMRAVVVLGVLLSVHAVQALAAEPADAGTLPPKLRAQVDRTVQEVLARTGAPSASIALVRDGRLAYARAYGFAHRAPDVPATGDTRYALGSVS